MTTLTLYKGVAFDGVNSFPHIASGTAFDSYLSGKQQYSQAINFNRIGEPILINEGYNTAIKYSYGCIDAGSEKYFIIPDSVSVNENNRVHLSYSVDWFTTLEYADAISFGRGHLVKSTDADPLTYSQSISPIDMTISEHIPLDNFVDGSYNEIGEIHVAYTTADASANVKWILSTVKNGNSRDITAFIDTEAGADRITGVSIGVNEIINGYLNKVCDIMPANIVGIYYIPFHSDNLFNRTAKYKDYGGKRYIWYELNETIDNPTFTREWRDFKDDNDNYYLTTNAVKRVHLVDRYGSVIYTVPYGRTLKRIIYIPIITPNACYVIYEFVYGDLPAYSHIPSTIQSAENSAMLYMCEKIDYNNEAYANWSMGLKGVEMEERRIQKNKALVQGLATAGLTGTIGASPSRGTIIKGNTAKRVTTGNALGAGVGVAAGMAGPLLSYGLDTYYESNINSLEDRKYQYAQDTMIPGGFLPDVFATMSIVELSASDDDIARYNNEISNFGVDCNLPVGSWTPSVGAYKFADVEVIADVPYSIKENVKKKLTSGIKIVGV